VLWRMIACRAKLRQANFPIHLNAFDDRTMVNDRLPSEAEASKLPDPSQRPFHGE